MKLSTRLSHISLKLRHDFLKLRIQKPLFVKALFATLVLIFVMAGLLSAYHFYIQRDDSVTLGEQTQLDIKTYSLNGEVTKVNGDSIEIKAGVIRTVGDDTIVEYAQKTVIVNNNTRFKSIKLEGIKTSSKPATLSDVKIGMLVAVYSSSNSPGSREVVAESIEMLEQ